MPTLLDAESGTLLGHVSETDAQMLVDQLEEEHGEDDDYFIDQNTIELLEGAGASNGLVELLRRVVGTSE